MTRSHLGAATIAFLLISSASADDKPLKGDLAKFQGTWTCTYRSADTTMNLVWTCTENRLNTEIGRPGSDSKIFGTCTIELDEQAAPHKLDLVNLVRRSPRKTKDTPPVTQMAIYEFIDADTIRICNGFSERPTEFRVGEGQRRSLFTLSRKRDEEKKP